MEEAPFLVAVKRIVCGIEIEDNPLGRPRVSLQERATNSCSIARGSWPILW
jgi:hypothetical protein